MTLEGLGLVAGGYIDGSRDWVQINCCDARIEREYSLQIDDDQVVYAMKYISWGLVINYLAVHLRLR